MVPTHYHVQRDSACWHVWAAGVDKEEDESGEDRPTLEGALDLRIELKATKQTIKKRFM